MSQLHQRNLDPGGTVMPLLGQPVRAEFSLWAVAGAGVVALVAATLTAPTFAPVLAALTAYGLGLMLTLALLRRGFPHPSLGLCNAVTLLRMALTAGLVAPLVLPPISAWAVFGVAAVALALDGADGWLARRQGRASDFGARFDMEVDSALALILALNAFVAGSAGVLVLLIALPRYIFVLAAVFAPWLNARLPERFSRKAVCVVQVGALIALQPQILPAPVATVVVAAVAVALLWSFWRDLRWLWQARA